jgi:hypothetical protein
MPNGYIMRVSKQSEVRDMVNIKEIKNTTLIADMAIIGENYIEYGYDKKQKAWYCNAITDNVNMGEIYWAADVKGIKCRIEQIKVDAKILNVKKIKAF